MLYTCGVKYYLNGLVQGLSAIHLAIGQIDDTDNDLRFPHLRNMPQTIKRKINTLAHLRLTQYIACDYPEDNPCAGISYKDNEWDIIPVSGRFITYLYVYLWNRNLSDTLLTSHATLIL